MQAGCATTGHGQAWAPDVAITRREFSMNLVLRKTSLAMFASASLLAVSGAEAKVLAPVTIDFQAMPAAVFGAANLALDGQGGCGGSGACYLEDGMLIGTVDDPNGIGEHVHRTGAVADRALAYHSDSSGFYLRAQDGSRFSMFSLDFRAPITDDNPDAGDDEAWEILGFSVAVNPDLAQGDGTHYATRTAYQRVANGFNGSLTLNAGFGDISALWIHYAGYPGVPRAKDFAMVTDSFKLGPAAPIPAPAAIWLLGSAIVLPAFTRIRHVRP